MVRVAARRARPAGVAAKYFNGQSSKRETPWELQRRVTGLQRVYMWKCLKTSSSTAENSGGNIRCGQGQQGAMIAQKEEEAWGKAAEGGEIHRILLSQTSREARKLGHREVAHVFIHIYVEEDNNRVKQQGWLMGLGCQIAHVEEHKSLSGSVQSAWIKSGKLAERIHNKHIHFPIRQEVLNFFAVCSACCYPQVLLLLLLLASASYRLSYTCDLMLLGRTYVTLEVIWVSI